MQEHIIHTKKAFDELSKSYDETGRSNGILQWMRGIVHQACLKYFSEGDEILELNAGTGEDAMFLAVNGIKVYATDISEKMIEILDSKVKAGKKDSMVRSGVFSFDEVCNIGKNDFDGVLSNFGGLNCIDDLSKLSADLALKIKPGGQFIAVVMNKVCPWEIFYYLLRLDPGNAFRRFRKEGIMADINGRPVKTFYFSPGRFGKFFRNNFKVEKVLSLSLLTPPPYLSGVYKKFSRIIKILMNTDNIVKGIFPFNRLGDHFIILMRIRPDRSIDLSGLHNNFS